MITLEEAARTRWPVAVIGGGIAGISLAYVLCETGVRCLLLEAGAIGGAGASAVPYALLNPYRGRGGKPGPLDLHGLSAFWGLVERLQSNGLEHGAVRGGVLRIPSNERQARSWRRVEGLLELDDAPEPFRAPYGAFLVEDGGWVRTGSLLSALVEAASDRGAEVVEGARVRRLEREGDDWRLELDRAQIMANAAVICTGAEDLDGVDLPPLQRSAGDVILLDSSIELPRAAAGPVYLSPSRQGVVVGGNRRPASEQDEAAPERLRASAARMVPQLARATIEDRWTGVRASSEDNVPRLQELASNLWFLGAFGGRGFLTGPLLAGRLADEIAAREPA